MTNNITAQDLYNYTKCPYRVYLESNGDPSQKGQPSIFVQLLWESGVKNEKEVIRQIGIDNIAEVKDVDIDSACLTTAKLMKDGVETIYQGCLKSADMVGRPDLLIKNGSHPSKYGDYYYEAIDIKSGKGVEDERTQRFKKHYAYQVMFYNDLLKLIQGYSSAMGKIINGDKATEEFVISDYVDEYNRVINEVRELKHSAGRHEPIISSACSLCVWDKLCKKWAKDNNDPSLIYFVGKNKYLLKGKGLNTIEDLAKMDLDKYLSPPYRMKGLAEKTLTNIKNRAATVLNDSPDIRPGYSFPVGKKEIYYDIEDDPTQDIVYLHGLYVIETNGVGEFKYFLANSLNDEGVAAKALWDYISENDNAIYYVYSSKERSTLKRLKDKYGLSEEVFDKYVAREYDLYTDLVIKYSDWPTYSYGLKNIAKNIGFKWRDEDPSGANSIVWYNQYLENNDPNVLRRILEYNEDDCKATYEIKKYFEGRLT
ncbi:MAG: TM0106 family RecB-like putative nuclease [Candidatus Margulisiibacteriota bacterium]